jgi:hypothetical protein
MYNRPKWDYDRNFRGYESCVIGKTVVRSTPSNLYLTVRQYKDKNLQESVLE